MKTVSVIIPCRDQLDYLRLSLGSYVNQTYPRDLFEIILVDDGSAEPLPGAIEQQWPVNLKVIRNPAPAGAGPARHEGFKVSTGDVILFTDSDMIVPRNFISSHAAHHRRQNSVAVTSPCRHRIFTILQPPDYGHRIFQKMLAINPHLAAKLPANFLRQRHPAQLFSGHDVANGELEQYTRAMGVNKQMRAFLNLYGTELRKCPLPWITFISYSASLTRETYAESGGFFPDIRFRHSDRALGFRLFRHGCSFICDSSIIPVHQQHPAHSDMPRWVREEYRQWLQKSRSRDVYLFGLRFINKIFRNVLFICSLAEQINRMEQSQPSLAARFERWLESWIHYYIQEKGFNRVIKDYRALKRELVIAGSAGRRFGSTAAGQALRILKEEQNLIVKGSA